MSSEIAGRHQRTICYQVGSNWDFATVERYRCGPSPEDPVRHRLFASFCGFGDLWCLFCHVRPRTSKGIGSRRNGREHWAPLIEAREPIRWWSDPATQPYIRAMVLLGDLLSATGRRDNARDLWPSFLELDPDGVHGSALSLEEVEATMPRR